MTEDKRPAENEAASLAKKAKTDEPVNYEKGVAYIKKEFIVTEPDNTVKYLEVDDDAAEQAPDKLEGDQEDKKQKKKKNRGQNKKRELTQGREKIQLCPKCKDPEQMKTEPCTNPKCNKCHDIKEYLALKSPDLEGECPNFAAHGFCAAGIKCRWLKSHYDFEAGKLLRKEPIVESEEINQIDYENRYNLMKKRYKFEYSDKVNKYLDQIVEQNTKFNNTDLEHAHSIEKKDNQFDYVEAPFKPWEKKRLDYSRAKVVSPLTTVGNLPYRRLMKKLYDVNVTFSEMALSLPLIQGTNSEWALIRAHKSEMPGFGAQIATSKQWQAVKAAELISKHALVSEINLNSGCPIDLLYKQGAGSGLLEQPAKTLRMLKGMNLSSQDVPITFKIRMGTREGNPVAESLINKVLHVNDSTHGVPDVAAITLHGRSRQQRYAKLADWDYIARMGSIVHEYNEQQEENKEGHDTPNKVFFIANGDVYNHEDWHRLVNNEGIDTVMIARGALIKPWLFDEIEAGQYIDKLATERLEIIKTYSKFALDHWGSDEYGVLLARRFLCEWLSFLYRYIPVGILEKLPHQLNERPPKWRGRNELETLLGSNDYKDWIKITEMFLGPAGEGFNFVPKHKSNAF